MSCPVCAKKTVPRYRPFCSKRCADIDLGKWMSGSYTLASDDPLDEDEAEAVLRAQNDHSQDPH